MEPWAFTRTGLTEIILPASVEVLGENCFSCADHFPLLHLNQGEDCLELKEKSSVKQDGLIDLFAKGRRSVTSKIEFSFAKLK
jgi:hypothetical protein